MPDQSEYKTLYEAESQKREQLERTAVYSQVKQCAVRHGIKDPDVAALIPTDRLSGTASGDAIEEVVKNFKDRKPHLFEQPQNLNEVSKASDVRNLDRNSPEYRTALAEYKNGRDPQITRKNPSDVRNMDRMSKEYQAELAKYKRGY